MFIKIKKYCFVENNEDTKFDDSYFISLFYMASAKIFVFSATTVIIILLIIAAFAQNYANENYSSSGHVGGSNGIFATHYVEDEKRIRNEENRRNYYRYGYKNHRYNRQNNPHYMYHHGHNYQYHGHNH